MKMSVRVWKEPMLEKKFSVEKFFFLSSKLQHLPEIQHYNIFDPFYNPSPPYVPGNKKNQPIFLSTLYSPH